MYVIGLDIGTTCTKALLADEKGKVLAVGNSGYPLISSDCRIEQSAQAWIDASVLAIREAIKGIDAGEVRGIALSTQGSSMVPVNEKGEFLGNAITWMDTRSAAEAEEIEACLGSEYIYRTTGWKINPALDAAKIRHLRKAEEENRAEYVLPDSHAAMYLSTLEVVNRFLTGNPVIDPTNAAIRQLYNVEQGCWDKKLMETAYITEEKLPKVLPTGAYVGGLRREAAEQMGLLEGIAVFNGAHDQYCASIGGGAVQEGDMLLSAGTTWVLMGIGKKPLFTESYIAPGKHPVKGLYGAMASLVCSGASLQWYKNQFLPEDFDTMNREAAERRERTKDLFFYPYLAGANYPIWNLEAKGTFTGITLEHDRFDFARAIMEGVAFGVRRGLDDFKANGCNIQQITMMGGASKSDLWCRMIADITHMSVLKLNQADVCAAGAAMIAACGLGIYNDYKQAADAMVHTERIYEPLKEEMDFYDQKYEKYVYFWDCMKKYY